ncbi:MAG: hypothetical protein IPM63_16640 [Acidobacteriota bacterium]|nr:MAG: hypothetical protein IPM63_16640 [Acidobacteriota bacterium]
MNHFNYFSEIESAFVRRRGRNLLLSPVDWALIESWEKEGIPLKIVLSTIDELFDQLEADPKRAGSIRTLSYCKDAVEARYRTWKESMVGAPENGAESGSESAEEASPEEASGDRLAGLSEQLAALESGFEGGVGSAVAEARKTIDELRDASGKPADTEAELDHLDSMIDDALLASADEAEIQRMRESALWELGERASLMDKDVLERTTELIVKKELRRASGIPGLGSFRL